MLAQQGLLGSPLDASEVLELCEQLVHRLHLGPGLPGWGVLHAHDFDAGADVHPKVLGGLLLQGLLLGFLQGRANQHGTVSGGHVCCGRFQELSTVCFTLLQAKPKLLAQSRMKLALHKRTCLAGMLKA